MTAPAIRDQSTSSNLYPHLRHLAKTVNDHLAAAEAATRKGLEHAIAAGVLLLEAKDLVEHGDWIPASQLPPQRAAGADLHASDPAPSSPPRIQKRARRAFDAKAG